jgi:FtsZ-binding cell division protein ZapB
MAIPKWSNMPNWAENTLIGGVVLGVGMIVAASFTMSERSDLKAQVATLEGEKTNATQENQRLTSELGQLKSNIKRVTEATQALIGEKQKLADENKGITARLVEANEKAYRLSQAAPIPAEPTAEPLAKTPAAAPDVTSPTPTDNKNEDPTVYVTNLGWKYHREGCFYLRKSSIPKPLTEILGRYTPCSRCNPTVPTDEQVARANSKSTGRSSARSDDGGSRSEVSDGQCTATTKKGTRCKRSARSGGRCWQHGG